MSALLFLALMSDKDSYVEETLKEEAHHRSTGLSVFLGIFVQFFYTHFMQMIHLSDPELEHCAEHKRTALLLIAWTLHSWPTSL